MVAGTLPLLLRVEKNLLIELPLVVVNLTELLLASVVKTSLILLLI